MHTANTRQQTANFGQTVPPCPQKSVPLGKIEKGVQFKSTKLSFFGTKLSPLTDRIQIKNPSYSLNMKGLSYFWRLLS